MSRLDANKIGVSLGFAVLILYVVCGIALVIFPAGTMGFFNYIFHGIDLSKIATKTVTLSGFIIGSVEVFFYTYVVGFLFAYFYNKFEGR